MGTPAPIPPSSVSIPASANEYIEQELDKRLAAIETADVFKGHAISVNGPLIFGVDDILRSAVEKRCKKEQADRLVILLTTPGGYAETVQRMVETVRHHYKLVDFVVPNYAYSAGTVFVMSGDAIYMDYYSRLGPIDPQVDSAKGHQVSALGTLEKYNSLIEKAQNGTITTAEVQLLIDGFDQGELYHYEQARDLSIALLEEWLVKYKFKNWKETKTRKIPVTDQMKKDAASRIGGVLNNTKKWHSHGYGISMDVLQRDPEINLLIDDYGNDPILSEKIRCYHELLSDYMVKRSLEGVIHSPRDYRPFM